MRQTIAQPIKYFLYARKSSESEDRQMQSIESQIEELTKLAKQNNAEIVEIFSEAKSAKSPGRDVFNKMMQRIKKGEANGIVCWKLNRLARNPIDGGEISWTLQQGIVQHILTFGRNYYPTDNVLMMAVELGMANQFVRDLSVDTKRGLRTKAELGWCPGSPPLGYLPAPGRNKGGKQIINDPDRFHLVKKGFELIISNKCTPPEAFRVATSEWGLRNKNGGKISISSWYYMLNNPMYYGEFEYPKGSGNWHKGKHEPMMSQTDFLKIQALLGKKGTTRPKTHTFTYTGIMQCGQCKAMITAEHKIKRNKNGNVHFYTYYHCTKRKDPNCTEKVVEEKDLETQISDFIKSINIPLGFKDWAVRYLRKTYAEELQSEQKLCEAQQRAIEAIEQRMSRLVDMRINNELSEAEFSIKKNELVKEKAQLEENLKKASAPSETWLDKLERALNVAEDIQKKFKTGDPKKKKVLVADLGSNLTIKDKKFTIEAENPILRIKKIASTSRAVLRRFEPTETPINKEKLELLYSSSPIMLRAVNDVRTIFQQSEGYIYIPDLRR